MDVLESEYAADLDFGGIFTEEVEPRSGVDHFSDYKEFEHRSLHGHALSGGWITTRAQCMQAAEGIKRAGRGGMLTGPRLAAIASLQAGATRLQGAILSAAGQEGRTSEDSVLWPIVSVVKVHRMSTLPIPIFPAYISQCCSLDIF